MPSKRLSAVECAGITGKVKTGDELEIDLTGGRIKNLTRNEVYEFVPMAEFAVDIMKAGGLLEYIKEK